MSEFKVGDKVYFIGKVTEIKEFSDYPVAVDFVGQESRFSFTFEGKYWHDGIVCLKKIEPKDDETTKLINALYEIRGIADLADENNLDQDSRNKIMLVADMAIHPEKYEVDMDSGLDDEMPF